MKKTYITPELLAVKIGATRMLAASDRYNVDPSKDVDSEEGVWSKSYSGGLMEDDSRE